MKKNYHDKRTCFICWRTSGWCSLTSRVDVKCFTIFSAALGNLGSTLLAPLYKPVTPLTLPKQPRPRRCRCVLLSLIGKSFSTLSSSTDDFFKKHKKFPINALILQDYNELPWPTVEGRFLIRGHRMAAFPPRRDEREQALCFSNSSTPPFVCLWQKEPLKAGPRAQRERIQQLLFPGVDSLWCLCRASES